MFLKQAPFFVKITQEAVFLEHFHTEVFVGDVPLFLFRQRVSLRCPTLCATALVKLVRLLPNHCMK